MRVPVAHRRGLLDHGRRYNELGGVGFELVHRRHGRLFLLQLAVRASAAAAAIEDSSAPATPATHQKVARRPPRTADRCVISEVALSDTWRRKRGPPKIGRRWLACSNGDRCSRAELRGPAYG